MKSTEKRELDPGYTWEVDAIDEQLWCSHLQKFDDANIYQTWSYGAVTTGERNMSHLILRKDGDVVAIAQIRIVTVQFLNAGIAYALWGPLWRRSGQDDSIDSFRQAIRALRNEYVCKRSLALRLFPLLFDNDSPGFSTILREEGFLRQASEAPSRTILMDLSPTIEDLRDGMKPHWKRELKVAERNGVEIIEGSGDELFGAFIEIYQEMVSRKRFVEPNDINQFRRIQSQLPEQLKMKIMLCKSSEQVSAGVVCSAIGRTAVYLFGATSNAGMKGRGSYLLQWKLIKELKQNRISVYDLNGINPATNPGTYKFKSDLAGRNAIDVCVLGRFDSYGSLLSRLCVRGWDLLRSNSISFRRVVKPSMNLVQKQIG